MEWGFYHGRQPAFVTKGGDIIPAETNGYCPILSQRSVDHVVTAKDSDPDLVGLDWRPRLHQFLFSPPAFAAMPAIDKPEVALPGGGARSGNEGKPPPPTPPIPSPATPDPEPDRGPSMARAAPPGEDRDDDDAK